MTILRDVFAELLSMFIGDWRLSAAVLAIVAAAALLIDAAGLDPMIGGAVLVVGCPALVLESVRRAARRSRG